MARGDPYEEIVVPRAAITFPLRVPTPPGFDPDQAPTWPAVSGRLEYVEGALWYTPPTGDDHQETAADVVTELNNWRRSHPELVVGANEAGMKLGGAVRAADAAVWRRSALPDANTGGLRRTPPVLAVEVAGIDDTVEMLREKARWYLAQGVDSVWILVPRERRASIVTSEGELELGPDGEIPERAALPGLRPRVADLFLQVAR